MRSLPSSHYSLGLLLLLTGCTGTFYVKNHQLYDSQNNAFTLHGINVPWSYYPNNVAQNLAVQSSLKANAVRIIIDHRYGFAPQDSDIQNMILAAKANKMVAVLTLMDYEGSDSPADLASAAQFWISRASWLSSATYAPYVIINVANEWAGKWDNHANWETAYLAQIKNIRAAGIKNVLIIDAAGYGQELASLTDTNYGANQLVQALNSAVPGNGNNLMFALHMYDQFYNKTEVLNAFSGVEGNLYVSTSADAGYLIEEFGFENYRAGPGTCANGTTPEGLGDYSNCPGDGNDIIELSKARTPQLGWLAWSWKGNNDPDPGNSLDMSSSWTSFVPNVGPNGFSWGNEVVTDPVGGLRDVGAFSSIFTSVSIQVEAEAGNALTGAAENANSIAGFSGTGYVTNFTAPADGSSVTVNVVNAGSYTLFVGYHITAGNGPKTNNVSVNGAPPVVVTFANTNGAWSTQSAGTFAFHAGINTISFTNNWGYMEVDYYTLQGAY